MQKPAVVETTATPNSKLKFAKDLTVALAPTVVAVAALIYINHKAAK